MLLQVQVLIPAAKETDCPSPITSIQCFYKYKFYSLLQKKQFVRPRSQASNASTSTSSTPCCKRNSLSVLDHQHPMLLVQVQVLLPAADQFQQHRNQSGKLQKWEGKDGKNQS
ncbi:hypothetical protein ElyMa_003586000 [Elysia marginata]|uniref:Uncharacterized protein n=1 Tax=Elysia marginata TaxID=1093978 RepID=A0AAV4EP32_9GAST|nr:hypothetical protein ElyMa_003586000 [Elysia marginata]